MATPAPEATPSSQENRNRGLGWAKVLLLLVLVGGLAAAGTWYVMGEQAKKDKAAMQKEIDELKASAEKEATVLEIREWKLQMTLPAELADLTYHQASDSLGGANLMLFSTKAFADYDSRCASGDEGPLGRISRENTPRGPEDYQATAPMKRIGSFYYYLGLGSDAPCSDKPGAPEVRLNFFEEAFNTLRSAS